MEGGTRWVRASLPPVAASVPAGRHLVRRWLDEVRTAGPVEDLTPDVVDDIELAVTEVVTNALVHAGTAVELTAELRGTTVRIEVADGSAHLPRRRGATTSSGTGRGLRLLDEVARRWGATARDADEGGGKVVWFEVGTTGAAGAPSGAMSAGPTPYGDQADTVFIVLLDVPILLTVAWREHVSALVREHLLIALEAEDPGHELTRHAAASQALAVLEAQWGGDDRDLDVASLLAASVEPQVTAARLELEIPRDAVAWFTALEDVIVEALELADEGRLLTAPTQPEMRAMRHWLVGEITGQVEGRAPQPHVFDIHPDGPRSDLVWDPSAVDGSEDALVATDDANRIVAASDTALDFLRTGRELVGRRLLTIIPRRFHQAHLAGFSLHLVNGRGPLIGAPVVVPVACGDGVEREAELLIKAERVNGRAVYIAEIRPI